MLNRWWRCIPCSIKSKQTTQLHSNPQKCHQLTMRLKRHLIWTQTWSNILVLSTILYCILFYTIFAAKKTRWRRFGIRGGRRRSVAPPRKRHPPSAWEDPVPAVVGPRWLMEWLEKGFSIPFDPLTSEQWDSFMTWDFKRFHGDLKGLRWS